MNKKTFTKRMLSIVLSVVFLLMLIPATEYAPASALTITYTPSDSYKNSKYYSQLIAVNLTGDQRTDIVNVAMSQYGYYESSSSSDLSGTSSGSGNYTEYGRWYGLQDAWCAMFIAWCAEQAQISTSIITKQARASGKSASSTTGYFGNTFKSFSSYTPSVGDIAYIDTNSDGVSNHVEIVSNVTDSTITTIGGNTNGGKQVYTHSLSRSTGGTSGFKIIGYECPNYSSSVIEPLATPTITTDKESYTVGDTVNLSWAASPSNSNLSHYWLTIDAPDGSRVINETMNLNTSYSFTVTQAGNYSATASATPKGSLMGEGSLTHNISIPVNPDVWYRNMTPVDLGTDFYALIFNTSYWKALTVEEDNNVDMRTEAVSKSQLWKFVRQDDGSYVIYNGDKVLDSTGGNTVGNNVYAYESYVGSDAQQWYIYGESGAYYFRSKTTDCVMDVCGNYSEDGTNIQMYTFHGESSQQFQIYCVITELSVTSGNKNTKTTFSWICNTASSRRDLKIWKDELWVGDAYCVECGASTPFKLDLPAGTYVAYVDSVFDDQPVMSNVVTFTVDEEYNPADINQDSQTTVLDVVLLQKYLLDLRTFTPLQFTTADLNSDSAVDGFDLALLKRMLLE